MRVSAVVHPLILTLACVEIADASFIGAAVRGVRAGTTAGRMSGSVNTLVQNAFRNVRTMLTPGTGQMATRIKDRAAAVRQAMTLSEEGKKFLKFGILSSTISGTVSGTISGNISKNSKKTRRMHTDRSELLSRELLARQDEVAEPGAAPEGISQYEWDLCFWDTVTAAHVVISGENNWIQMDGLPPICVMMNDNLAGDPEAGAGINCGQGCIRYENLSPEDFNSMADYLNGLVP
ncbi:hypothetical protein HYQ45_007706 [Verticillium longisporum]|uniref:Uncharacterized protein n=3 Tax=Verticillium TaxID=1036719 RepID=G2WU23_VERDV|nr:uncharacterized protein VDAG_01296 [Verticillium dahliae VdLs.17]KAF3348375.1 hypothetical protein VdG2_03257 [Verticillium dahliae VDG2]KAF3359175.1 hypothetical protein VdG1_02198 [Verticillium dahliae VDG1]KAG7134287.1 hypothetical protein HYQ45_007706 [Verticillium longisporum]KAH6690917.1 hypothetical protein EV126DRAFT_403201 [Verticillium dahliae]EGY17614.1 hypothetical protein VDAG_01296 [Verticillium dahliae VdLs.17]